MKTIVFIFFGLFLTFVVAQEDTVVSIHKIGNHDEQDYSKSYYYKDSNSDLNKFLGTWVYNGGNKKLTLVFYKLTHKKSGKDYIDRIYAKFKYEENGIVTYNTLIDQSTSAKYKIFGSSFDLGSTTKMNLRYNEPTTIPYERMSFMGMKPSPSLDIEYVPCTGLDCKPQLKWHIIFYTNVESTAPIPFKIPLDLTLTKQ